MRDVVRTHYHWYMLFEYVNGGQMLDYIISHGRLKEKQARKFARQIASALDYCHRNSIVHRDLKIENILISKTGDIKIIDFGLSNLFSPRSHLKTFCGSLYFAAPELLQARQYVGPEVDVWSFGIVLYVLVCGKVPFDDQSMPQLHAKIKKGIVDYPQWLSTGTFNRRPRFNLMLTFLDCKHLISRMLVTDPRQRASLQEIMNHSWMSKGFSAPLENYLPAREVLQLPLDPEVIQGMTGFDFGPPDFIASQLTRILESEDYQTAVRAATREQSQYQNAERKRGFAGFEFYKRRNSISRDTLTNASAEAIQSGVDPISAYSPLISIYHLVKEKQQRRRRNANPGVSDMPRSPGERPLKMPDLPAPAAAHTNDATYELPGEAATGGRARPRARTHGEDDVADSLKKMNLEVPPGSETAPVVAPPTEQAPVKRESTAVGLLRRLSTRRHRDPEKDKAAKTPTANLSAPGSGDLAGPARKSFSVPRAREREAPPVSMLRGSESQSQHQDLLSPPGQNDTNSRRGSSLARATSVNSADLRRRSGHRAVSEASPTVGLDPPLTSGSDRSSNDDRRLRATDGDSEGGERPTSSSRAPTVRARSLGHARRESMQTRRAKREQVREAGVPEETDQELAASGGSAEAIAKSESAENVKPVYLKGLFSVSTTSPKPVGAIRAEIIRVLKQLGVEYMEIRGGFRCKHTPSIDLNKVQDNELPPPDRGMSSIFSPTTRRRISFGGFMGGGGDRDEFRDQQKPPNTPRTPSRRQIHDASPTFSEGSDMSVEKGAPAAGETTTHVQSELGGSMVLSFEIIIVKVPILALHGIQFKRMAGGTWQYKNMADKILKQLRL